MPSDSVPLSSKVKHDLSGLFPILKETASDWMEDNAMRLSAALALYTILSMAPLLVICLKIVSIFWGHSEKGMNTFRSQLSGLMGDNGADTINQMIANAAKPGQGVIAAILGFVILLFSATGVFAELQDSMNTIWGVKPKPKQGVWGFIRNRLLSMSMVFGIGFLLLVSMFVSTVLTAAATAIFGQVGWIVTTLESIASLLVVILLFAGIFKVLPDVRINWRDVWVGAVLTAVLFAVGKFALGIYFKKAAPASAFGALGSPVALLLWIYYSAFILFFGAEFTKVWSLHHGRQVVPDAHAMKVTEEDRAQTGIPSKSRIEKAAAGKPLGKPVAVSRPALRPQPVPSSGHFSLMDYAMAAGGLVVGAVAGGIGVHLLGQESALPASGDRGAARLNDRIKALEARVGSVSRIARHVDRAAIHDRISEVEKTIRHASREMRRSR